LIFSFSPILKIWVASPVLLDLVPRFVEDVHPPIGHFQGPWFSAAGARGLPFFFQSDVFISSEKRVLSRCPLLDGRRLFSIYSPSLLRGQDVEDPLFSLIVENLPSSL